MKTFKRISDELDVIYNVFTKAEDIQTDTTKKVAVVVFVDADRTPIVYDVTDYDNIDEAIASMVSRLTIGCCYTYKLQAIIDNVYFYK